MAASEDLGAGEGPARRRPRLAEHVVARQHVRGAAAFVLLHDERRGTVERIDRRTWLVLSVADGSRDIEGIRLAARRLGAHATTGSIRALVDELAQREMVLDGPPPFEPDRVSEAVNRTALADRPIEHLEGFSLHCDGSGGCCRQYDTFMLTPEDAARARAWVPRRAVGPIPAERLLMPMRGSAPVPLAAVTRHEGGCAYLDADGGCAIHRAGGANAKPVGCDTYPMRYVDDGAGVRQSIRLECACVFDSIGRPGEVTPPLRVGDLPAATAIETLEPRLPIGPGVVATRESMRTWSDALLQHCDSGDLAARVWAWADAIESRGLDPMALDAVPGRPSPERPARWVEALHRVAVARLRRDAAWRGEGDFVLRALRWVVSTTAVVRRPEVWREVMSLEPDARHESLYLRATAFGYAWLDGRPLVDNLRDRAIRLWLARAMPALSGVLELEAGHRHPLALLEMLMRAHGLVRYADGL
jgi:lysine-N-methylase